EHRCANAGWKFECGVCGKKCGSVTRLKAHEKSHGYGGEDGQEDHQEARSAPNRRGAAAKNLECGECKKLFSTETSLAVHR
ncbi:ZN574 protein, partial [Prunella himalayana]|nr:ZN574 protein [Prunella himalayana]